MGKLTISMVMFNSYVKLPEGIRCQLSKSMDKWWDSHWDNTWQLEHHLGGMMASSWTVLENNSFSSPNDRPSALQGWSIFSLASGTRVAVVFLPSQTGDFSIDPIGSMYGIYANIGGILMVNVTIYSTMDPMGMKQPEKNIHPSGPGSEPGFFKHCLQVASQTSSEGEPDVKPRRFTPKGIRCSEIWDLHMGKPHPMDSLQDIHAYSHSLLWNGLWLVMAGVFGIKPDLTSEMTPGSSPLFAMSITPKNIPHLPLTVSLDGCKI